VLNFFKEAHMEQNKRSGRDAKRSYWGDHIAGWKQSGLSQQAYCRKHQLSLSSFGYWRSRLKRGGDDQARFHPVMVGTGTRTISPQPEHPDSGLGVILGNERFHITIKQHFCPATLRELIGILEQR
jgi:hypothetical protein